MNISQLPSLANKLNKNVPVLISAGLVTLCLNGCSNVANIIGKTQQSGSSEGYKDSINIDNFPKTNAHLPNDKKFDRILNAEYTSSSKVNQGAQLNLDNLGVNSSISTQGLSNYLENYPTQEIESIISENFKSFGYDKVYIKALIDSSISGDENAQSGLLNMLKQIDFEELGNKLLHTQDGQTIVGDIKSFDDEINKLNHGEITSKGDKYINSIISVLGDYGLSEVTINGQANGDNYYIAKNLDNKYVLFGTKNIGLVYDSKIDALNAIGRLNNTAYTLVGDLQSDSNGLRQISTYINFEQLKKMGGKQISEYLFGKKYGNVIYLGNEQQFIKFGDDIKFLLGHTKGAGKAEISFDGKNFGVNLHTQINHDYATVGMLLRTNIEINPLMEVHYGMGLEMNASKVNRKFESVGFNVQMGGGVEYELENGNTILVFATALGTPHTDMNKGNLKKELKKNKKLDLNSLELGAILTLSNGLKIQLIGVKQNQNISGASSECIDTKITSPINKSSALEVGAKFCEGDDHKISINYTKTF